MAKLALWQWGLHTVVSRIILCVRKGHKSSPFSSMTTRVREAIILKYWVLITVSWLNRRLTTTQGRSAQKPFMMCHLLQGLIRNRDKREEVLTFVQSKFYFKRVMRLRCNFVLKKKLVLCMVKSLHCVFPEYHVFISDQPSRNSHGTRVWLKAIRWKFCCFSSICYDQCYTHAALSSY